MAPPFEIGQLRYLYCGSVDVEKDVEFYTAALGAQLLWQFDYSGTKVAAVRFGDGPFVLLADHRPAPSVLPIWEVADMQQAKAHLEKSGFQPGREVEVPDGPVLLLKDPAGNEVALLHAVRPGAADGMARSFREGRQEESQ